VSKRANNWAPGYKTYRRGEAVGFVPALDSLAVRQISDRYRSEEERIGIRNRSPGTCDANTPRTD
jgi:hypothetical protein